MIPTDRSPSYRALFALDGFVRLVTGMLLARIAGQMVGLVLVLLVLERYGSPVLAGLATFLALAPGLMVSPIVGTLLDRYGRRRLIVLDYCFALASLLLIAALAVLDALPAPLLLAIVSVQSLTFPLSTVGQRTLFPLVVPRPLWPRANAVDSNGYALSGIVGPALAGAIVAAFHGEGGLVAAAAMFAVAAVVTATAPDPAVDASAHGSILRAAWDGIVHVVRHPTLRGIAVGASISSVGNGILFITIPVVVLERLGGTTVLVGQLFALMGAVAFVAVMFAGRLRIEGRERAYMVGSVLGGALAISLLLVRLDLTVLVVAIVVRAVAEAVYDVPMFTLRQRRTDPAWLGRAFAVSMSLNFIGYPVGSAIGGGLNAISAELALVVAVAAWLLGAALMWVMLPRD
ncbi:MAG: MFS transporter [Chloroflexi bacterium]|nr:MFS transporter [Chloroflexota bacterium]